MNKNVPHSDRWERSASVVACARKHSSYKDFCTAVYAVMEARDEALPRPTAEVFYQWKQQEKERHNSPS
jgi:hypothetical protein